MSNDTTLPRKLKNGGEAGPKAFALEDLGVVIGLGFIGPVGWLLPEKSWRPLCRFLAPLAMPFVVGGSGILRKIERLAGGRLTASPRAVVREAMAHHIERMFPYMRDYRPGGWHPQVSVTGREHLEAAQAAGRGVVLWDAHFAFSSLVTKLGMSREGFWLHHLSHPRHGFNPTGFSIRFLNPILTRIERRYLGERVVMGFNESKEALHRLQTHLSAGGIASVKVGGTAKRPLVAPFLDGEIHLGAGAPLLAYNSDALLIPCFTTRGEDGSFTIEIEPPLDLPREGSRGEALQAAARAYAQRLEPHVLAKPGQWLGWAEA